MFRTGDLALTRNRTAWYAFVICWVTRGRYSHVRLIVDAWGKTIEAGPKGTHWGRVQPEDVIVRPPLTEAQRATIQRLAPDCIGIPYGWVDVAILGLAQLGIRLPALVEDRLDSLDRLFCSQLIARLYRLAGYHAFKDGRQPQNVSPADLADRALRGGWEIIRGQVHTSAQGGALRKRS